MIYNKINEFANLPSDVTKFENIVIWVGNPPANHGHRIKISNTPNKFTPNDCFVITIPDKRVIGKVNKNLINNKTLEQLKTFVDNYGETIIYYLDNKIYKQDLFDIIDGTKTLEQIFESNN